MKVQIGSSSSIEMTPTEAAEATRRHFAAHGVNLEYLRFEEDGEIQFKMPTGFKVIIRPNNWGPEGEVVLC